MKTTRILAFLASIATTAACGGAASEKPVDQKAAPKPNPLEISAGDNLQPRLTLGEPAWAEVALTQTVAARIEVNQTKVTRVGSPVMGRITMLAVHEGQHVRRGDLLALLNSTGLSDAQLFFLKSDSQRKVAQRAVERAQVLLKNDVIGEAELQRREAEHAQAQAEFDAARDQLVLMGMAPEAVDELERSHNINSVARIVASMNGTVLDRKLTLGQVIQPADTAFEIADLSDLWLEADVPEQQAGKLHVGTPVEAEVAALPGVKIRGELSFVSATVNPDTRTVRVRMDLPNPDGKFKPAMLATVKLTGDTARQRVVPTSAVIREENGEFIFVQVDGNKYALRPVKLGVEIDSSRVLTEGLKDGEKIVVDGAFHLNNERRRQLLRASEEE